MDNIKVNSYHKQWRMNYLVDLIIRVNNEAKKEGNLQATDRDIEQEDNSVTQQLN